MATEEEHQYRDIISKMEGVQVEIFFQDLGFYDIRIKENYPEHFCVLVDIFQEKKKWFWQYVWWWHRKKILNDLRRKTPVHIYFEIVWWEPNI